MAFLACLRQVMCCQQEIDDEYDKFWSKIWQEQVRRHQSSGEGSSTLSDVLNHHKATMMGAEDGIVSWPKRYPGQGAGDDLDDGKKPEIPVTPVPMSYKSSAGTGLEDILPDENGTSCIDYDLLFENPKGEVEKVVFGVTVGLFSILLPSFLLFSSPTFEISMSLFLPVQSLILMTAEG